MRRVANLVALPLAAFYTILPRDHQEVRAVAKRTAPLFATADFTIFIWSAIFAGHVLYAIYQGLPRQSHRPLHRAIGGLTVLNSVLIAAFIFSFSSEWFFVSFAAVVAMLGNLIEIDRRVSDDGALGKAHWLVRLPYSLNLGWAAAMVFFEGTRLVSLSGYTGTPFTPLVWADALALAMTGLGAWFTIVRGNVPATLAVAWGLVGVAANALGTVTSLTIAAGTGSLALIGVIALEAFALHRVTLREPQRDRMVHHHPERHADLHVPSERDRKRRVNRIRPA